MPSIKNRKRNLLAGMLSAATSTALVGPALASTLLVTAVSAGGFEPLQRLGRHCGFGWGDGYHACASSGIRPGADLPPRSYSKQFHGGCLPGSPCASRFGAAGYGGSYYDQFDRQFAGQAGGGACDNGSCDDAALAAFDYARSQTYVVPSQHGHRTASCDSPQCDTPGCDGIGCDAGSFSSGQTWSTSQSAPTSQSMMPGSAPAYAQPVPNQWSAPDANQASPSMPPNASPNTSVAPAPEPLPATASEPTPTKARPIRPSESAQTIDADDVPSPSDAAMQTDASAQIPDESQNAAEPTKPLRLPEVGSSVDEGELPSADLESFEDLPAPRTVEPATEIIPTPEPTPAAKNPPMPETLGPLDANFAPTQKLPEGWTEKPVDANPFVEPDAAQPVSLPSESLLDDLIPEATPGGDEDDLLLFESAMLPRQNARQAQRSTASQDFRAGGVVANPFVAGQPASQRVSQQVSQRVSQRASYGGVRMAQTHAPQTYDNRRTAPAPPTASQPSSQVQSTPIRPRPVRPTMPSRVPTRSQFITQPE